MCKGGEARESNKPEDTQGKLREKKESDEGQNREGVGRKGWRDILDELDYSSGPGDNIYVFG